jgi:sugar lactone lactonase YvrE
MPTTIVTSASNPLTLYYNNPFTYSFTANTVDADVATIQFTDSTPFLISNVSGSNFASTTGYSQYGLIGNLVVDAISPNRPKVETFVGSGIAGTTDGTGSNAQFNRPQDLCIDGNGDLYVCDTFNHLIRKVTSAGVVTTYAGTGVQGGADGPAGSATFDFPTGSAVDGSGNLYVGSGRTIRKITSGGTVSTLAGLYGVFGYVDGASNVARFTSPNGMTIGGDGYLYVADVNAVRRVDTTTGTTTTYTGQSWLSFPGAFQDGTLANARFNTLQDIYYHPPNGSFYLADSLNNRIRRISGGFVSTVAGTGAASFVNGPGSNATFHNPSGVWLDSTANIYVMDRINNVIRKIDTNNVVSTYTGVGTIGLTNGFSNVQFAYPYKITIDSNDSIYVADEENNVIRKAIAPVPDVRPSGTRPSGQTIVATTTIPVSVSSRIVTTPTIVSPLNLYKYVPFSYSFTRNIGTDTLRYTASSAELFGALSFVGSDISFSSVLGLNTSYTNQLNLVIEAVSNTTIVETLSNAVFINPATFTTPINNTLLSLYLFQPFTPLRFESPISVSTPTSSPALPPGLRFVQVSSNIYDLSGNPYPLVSLPTSNYRIFATQGSKVVSTTIRIGISGEFVLLNLDGPSTISNMTTYDPISPLTITANYPFSFPGNLIYTWGQLPGGLNFTDVCGTIISNSGFSTTDASSTLILTGTPTVEEATSFANAGISSAIVGLRGTRVSAPLISNTKLLTFSFGETVLFSNVTVPDLFIGETVPTIPFVARTYFSNTNSLIATMESFDLRADLGFTFNPATQIGVLTGIPEFVDSNTFTFTATNSNGVYRNLTVPIVSKNDIITFTSPAIDSCYSLIISRDLSNEKSGYYTYPIQFSASALSGNVITYSVTGLEGTGISLSNGVFIGTPVVPLSLTTLSVTATAANTGVTATRDISLSILPDVITFKPLASPLTLIQNRTLTPTVQFDVSSVLSDLPIVGYSSSNLPSDLLLSSTGVLSGEIESSASGSFTLAASTAFTVGTSNVPYTVIPDDILVLAPQSNYSITDGSSFPPIHIIATSYSGKLTSNYALSNFDNPLNTYGLTINSNTGLIGGTFNSAGLVGFDDFIITAMAGTATGQLAATITSNQLIFSNNIGSGPTFTSPTSFLFPCFQYMPIVPIQLTAVGTGTIYYFVETDALPLGLSFDPTNDIIKGTPMRSGIFTVNIYTKDSIGITNKTLRFEVTIPRIIKPQSNASAYTSLVRQYTTVNAAQNARDSTVLPNESVALGEFMAPQPPDRVSDPFNPNCCNPNTIL